MAARHIVNVDLAKVFGTADRKDLQRILTWGSAVEVVKITATHVEIKTTKFETQADGSIKPVAISGFIVPPKGT